MSFWDKTPDGRAKEIRRLENQPLKIKEIPSSDFETWYLVNSTVIERLSLVVDHLTTAAEQREQTIKALRLDVDEVDIEKDYHCSEYRWHAQQFREMLEGITPISKPVVPE